MHPSSPELRQPDRPDPSFLRGAQRRPKHLPNLPHSSQAGAERYCTTPSGMTSPIIDQALDEWNALVRRERNPANRVRTYSPGEDGSPPPSSERRYHSCPPELREEICDWFYRVVDHQ